VLFRSGFSDFLSNRANVAVVQADGVVRVDGDVHRASPVLPPAEVPWREQDIRPDGPRRQLPFIGPMGLSAASANATLSGAEAVRSKV
jgi:hypothetical protein